MSFASLSLKIGATLHNNLRDKDLEVDPEIQGHYDIQYGESEKHNSLDVYYPKGTKGTIPVIVNFHGGGYVYGTKKTYLYYGMFLAKQGFVFVNASYHLAPKKKYPTQLEELNLVMEWVMDNHEKYYMDVSNVFIVGDSAGAQLALQYSTLYSNPNYAELFSFDPPEDFTLRGVALNCGMYNIYNKMVSLNEKNKKYVNLELVLLLKDYLGENWRQYEDQLATQDYITEAFPPTYLMTAEYDFLREETLPMVEVLTEHGVTVTYKKHGEPGQKQYVHIFHCNLSLDEAKEANRIQCDYFKSLIQQPKES
ncbi:MAG: alpha/beta hydrolase [Alkalibacterium sp.]|uniref:alpha/beta hydrolase n=1 Tax=Alkalibacterium sp. TaxID=1872447 RepID=UPI0039707ECB